MHPHRSGPPHTATAPAAVNVDKVMAQMSLEEKVGQLLMVGFGGTEVNGQIAHWVRDRRVGGVALFSRNIVDLPQTAKFTRDLLALSDHGIPIFLALDQEGGNVVRVKDGATLLPGNMALGATREPTLAYVAGQALAIDLRLLGFNMNLAPVLDVNSNPANPVIGIRSYGERPDLVGYMGEWYVRGQQEMGVVAVAKHFPGHGDTQADSHFSMPSIDADINRLDDVELYPFKQAISAGLDAIMTAHIALPKVAERSDIPATLSHVMLTDILRKRLGFEGVVVTDGLEMQGIVQKYGTGRAAVMAILAGADMPMVLWSTESKEEVYQALLSAVHSGEISHARLNESVRRILSVKARRGLFNRKLEPLDVVLRSGNRNPVHEKVADRIAREAVTLVRNHNDVLPLKTSKPRRVVVLAPPGPFGKRLAEEPNVTVVTVPFVPSREQRRDAIAHLTALARDADVLVAAVVNRYHVEIVHSVQQQMAQLPIALLSFASPYYLKYLPEVDGYVCTYSYLDAAQVAAADAVLGHTRMTGRLPISIPGFYAYGHRVEDRLAAAPSAQIEGH